MRHRHFKPITKLGTFYFFVTLGVSLVSTIWSVYLNSFLHSSALVGFLTSLFTVVETLAFVFLIPLIERTDKAKTLVVSLVFFAASYFLFSVYSNIYLVIVLGILISVFSSLRITTFGLIVRDNTEDENVSKNEGFVYTLFNSAWLVGPLIAGYVASKFGFESVFFLTTLFIVLSLFSFRLFRLKDGRITKKVDKNILQLIAGFFRRRELVLTYALSMAVTFWWSFIYVYMPIYIVDNGYGEVFLGIFLAAITAPLILFEYLFGKMAGKRGFKKLFFAGFFSLGIFALAGFFVSNIYILCGILVLASISVAMLEPTTEAYFLDLVRKKDRDRYYGIYTTSVNLGSLLGALPAAGLLLVLPFKSLFMLYGIPMIILAFLALKIKDSYEFRKKHKDVLDSGLDSQAPAE